MITQQTFVEGSTIDITNVTEILAFKTSGVCYREIRIVDDQHHVMTLRLYADTLEKLKVLEEKP